MTAFRLAGRRRRCRPPLPAVDGTASRRRGRRRRRAPRPPRPRAGPPSRGPAQQAGAGGAGPVAGAVEPSSIAAPASSAGTPSGGRSSAGYAASPPPCRRGGLAPLARPKVGEGAGRARTLQLPVECWGGAEERTAASADAPGRPARRQLGAQALPGAEDELGDGVLVEADELADLGVRPVLELAEGEHEALPPLEPGVGERTSSCWPAGACRARGRPRSAAADRARAPRRRLHTLRSLDLLEEEVARRREEVRRQVDAVGVEAVERGQRLDEGLLDQVVRVVGVARSR